MELIETAQIWHFPSKTIHESSIVRLTRDVADKMIDKVWWDGVPSEKREKEWDQHWVWTNLLAERERKGAYEFLAVVSRGGYVEGAMIYKSIIESKLVAGNFCGYIDYLATAPRNRRRVTVDPVYGGVGTVLTYKAVKRSYETTFGGRIFLGSLPTLDTMNYYEKCGFIRTSPFKPIKNDELVDYELPEAKAKEWLEKQGDLL